MSEGQGGAVGGVPGPPVWWVPRREGSEVASVAAAAACGAPTMRRSVIPTSGARRFVQRVRLLWITATGSVKVKLLLACCIAFTVLLIAGRAFSATSWRHHLSVHAQPMPRRGYTIFINTWKRNDLLKKSVQHYAFCSGVDSIHIVWSETDPPSDLLFAYLKQAVEKTSRDGKNIELKFDLNLEDSLNNRFKDIKELTSDAIFSIDDDVLFPCTSVEFAFNVWQSAPATLVGFVPRMHWLYKSRDGQEYYRYRGWWTVWWTGTYSMVLTKAAFFHRKYLALYTNQMPSSIRDYVTNNRNCEDIAMSFLVANVTDSPPIWVKGKIYEMGLTGISSLGGHNERRSRCLNDFTTLYGRMPLVSTTVKAVDSRESWFW
uniref:Exostosin-2 n=1 Tax=Anthurium amnicola TaxID=1678845 RepID=A0A1D1Y1X4_9ARAE